MVFENVFFRKLAERSAVLVLFPLPDMPKASTKTSRSKALADEQHPYKLKGKPAKPASPGAGAKTTGASAFAYAGGTPASPSVAGPVSGTVAGTVSGTVAGTVSGTVAAPDGALVPGTSPYQFDLPACDEMPPEKIMRMLGFEKTSDGKIIIHKKPNGYRDSSISLFDGPVRGHKIEIKFADFANEGSQWKIVLTSKTAACLRAIQDAWFNFYLENAKGLAAVDDTYVKLPEWLDDGSLVGQTPRWENHCRRTGGKFTATALA